MRVLVCGGRNYENYSLVERRLSSLLPKLKMIIHGAATGADSPAQRFAEENEIPVIQFPARWDLYGRAAGPIRNQEMLEIGCPDLVMAFPGGRGTAGMVRLARMANVKVEEIRDISLDK